MSKYIYCTISILQLFFVLKNVLVFCVGCGPSSVDGVRCILKSVTVFIFHLKRLCVRAVTVTNVNCESLLTLLMHHRFYGRLLLPVLFLMFSE